MRDIAILQERIKQGNQAIQKARTEGKDTAEWENHLNTLNTRLFELLDQIPGIKLSEFEKADYSIEVYSTVLKRSVWLCPGREAAEEIRREDLEAVCYTVDELRHLISLNPGPESLKSIREGKVILSGTLIDHKTQ